MNQIGIDSHHVVSTFLVVFDLTGTFIFALSGAIAAVKHRLDAFGILVLCFVTGNAGGITRDIMIGALPPAAIDEWRYVAVSILAGVIVFFGYPVINRLSSPVMLFDAPYINASGVVPPLVPPPASDRPLPSPPHELASICRATIANRRTIDL